MTVIISEKFIGTFGKFLNVNFPFKLDTSLCTDCQSVIEDPSRLKLIKMQKKTKFTVFNSLLLIIPRSVIQKERVVCIEYGRDSLAQCTGVVQV